jgi:hypothetical protein
MLFGPEDIGDVGREENLLLAIESARSVAERTIQTFRMIRCADEEETVVALETVELVKEEASVLGSDEGVEIFQD